MVACTCTDFPDGLGPVTIGRSLTIAMSLQPEGYRLDVNGNARIIGALNAYGNARITGGDQIPLSLRGGNASYPWSSVINFEAQTTPVLWQLGAGIVTGNQQEFGLKDVYNGGVTRLYVGPSGNVGIGTVTPAHKLEVQDGPVRIQANTQFPLVIDAPNIAGLTEAAVVQFRNNAGTARWYIGHVTDFLLYDYTANPPTDGVRLQVQAGTGNVGIGTVPGSSRLAVRSADSNASTNIVQTLASNNLLGVGIGFNAIRLVGSAASQSLLVDAKEAGHLVLQTQATGNVGVGTTGPQAKLHVAGNTMTDGNVGIGTVPATSRLTVKSLDSVASTTILQTLASNDQLGVGIGFNAIRLVGPAASQSLLVDAKEAGHLVLQTQATGNVGVGTTGPQAKLHVAGTAVVDGNVGIGTVSPATRLDASGTIRSTAQTNPSSGEGVELLYATGQGTLQAYARPSGPHRRLNIDGAPLVLNLGSASSVGIGTASPQAQLHVNQNAIVEQDLTVKSSIRAGNPSRKIADGSGCYYA